MKIRRVFSEMAIAFEHEAPLLLVGETGVGKKFLSQLLHHQQTPETSELLPLSCGILTDEQIDQQLFSRFSTFPDQSVTILIQEINTLSGKQQQQLLSLLDHHDSSESSALSRCRIIVSCQQDLLPFVEQGHFRADLYYHLNAHRFEIPPLRERLDEITGLTRQFVRYYSQQYNRRIDRIEDSLIQRLMAHTWPGNVRELKHIVARAVMYCDAGILNESHLPGFLKSSPCPHSPVQQKVTRATLREPTNWVAGLSLETQLASFERKLIQQSLIQNLQCRTDAARELGVSRVTLYNKMKKLGLETQKSAE